MLRCFIICQGNIPTPECWPHPGSFSSLLSRTSPGPADLKTHLGYYHLVSTICVSVLPYKCLKRALSVVFVRIIRTYNYQLFNPIRDKNLHTILIFFCLKLQANTKRNNSHLLYTMRLWGQNIISNYNL